MPEVKFTQEDVTASLRDRIGNLMLMLWQQEAYIKSLEAFVAEVKAADAPVEVKASTEAEVKEE